MSASHLLDRGGLHQRCPKVAGDLKPTGGIEHCSTADSEASDIFRAFKKRCDLGGRAKAITIDI